MISFQPNTVEETEFRSHQFLLRSTRHLYSHLRDGTFTQSCVFQSENRGNPNMTRTNDDLYASVHVVSTGKGQYTVYQPAVKYAGSHPNRLCNSMAHLGSNSQIAGDGESSKQELLRSFKHHISNLSSGKSTNKLAPNDSEDRQHFTASQKENRETRQNGFRDLHDDRKKTGRMRNEKKTDDTMCACKSYHTHTFSKPEFFRTSDDGNVEFEVSLSQIRSNLVEANEKHLIICNTFWRPFLAISEFQDGDNVVQFRSLWHDEGNLKELLREGIQNTVLRTAISDLTLMAVSIGPIQLLKSLIDLSLVRVDSMLEDGAGLLHHACLFRRSDLIQYLVQVGVSPSLKDRQGELNIPVSRSGGCVTFTKGQTG